MKDFISITKLPKPPRYFGHENLISDWGMLANDQCRDCVFAGPAHETLMWNKEAGNTVTFNNQSVLKSYP